MAVNIISTQNPEDRRLQCGRIPGHCTGLPKELRRCSKSVCAKRTLNSVRILQADFHLENSVPATEEDWGKEYLDYILSIKTVGSIEEAVPISTNIIPVIPKLSSQRIMLMRRNSPNEIDAAWRLCECFNALHGRL